MKHTALSLSLLALLGIGTLAPSFAQVTPAPALLNYQGRLVTPSGNPVPDGTYSIRFSLWDAVSAGTEKWNQTIANVQVKNGTFAVLLNTNTAGLFNGDLWLETKIGTDAALTPRQQLVSVAYALKANSVPDGSIGANQIANGSITSNKLASGALDTLSWLLSGNNITNPTTQFFGTTSNQPLVFRTNNTEKMRLLANGNLGLGNTAPGMSLEVTTPTYYAAPALGVSLGANRWAYLHAGASDPSYIWNTGSAMRFGTETARGTNYTELMRLNSNGQLGIGTATTTSALTFRNADERKITYWETADSNNRFYGVDLLGGRVRHWTGVFGSFEVGNFNNADGAFNTRFSILGNGNASFFGTSTFEFGAGVAGKQSDAGKIGYQTYSGDSLDIVGAGTTGTNRKVRFYTEGGIVANGPLTLAGSTNNMLGVASSNTIGTWFNLQNTSTGGRTWSVISAGSGNGEGAGTLVFNTQGTVAAQLKSTGEFIANVVTVLGGSDVAEPYNVAPAGNIKAIPGMLVAIDSTKIGQMRVVSKAYDTAVAGIVSGANGVNPGITLRQKGTVADGELPVASIGRVWCYCDADANGAIEAGDLLTSSDTPGHAMKATDRERRDGAVIGKAMSSLKSGKGLVLVLVSLK